MEFEFDPNKSASNLDKHGISFEEAQKIWNDPFRVEIPARTLDEARMLAIGKIKDTVWSAVFTWRRQSVRIISVRRARKNEQEIYYSAGI